jgi:hypothetical protein
VVFCQPKVGRHSRVRHSWTAPCFILSANFADVHPADEDPMPLNGNPHPLPLQLEPDFHQFVVPEYREIGWNMPPPSFFAPDFQHQDQQHNQVQHDQQLINLGNPHQVTRV